MKSNVILVVLLSILARTSKSDSHEFSVKEAIQVLEETDWELYDFIVADQSYFSYKSELESEQNTMLHQLCEELIDLIENIEKRDGQQVSPGTQRFLNGLQWRTQELTPSETSRFQLMFHIHLEIWLSLAEVVPLITQVGMDFDDIHKFPSIRDINFSLDEPFQDALIGILHRVAKALLKMSLLTKFSSFEPAREVMENLEKTINALQMKQSIMHNSCEEIV